MKALFAFIKKEFIEQLRTGKLTLLGILFVLFGIMNAAVAKLTPWLLQIMSDTLAESGMTVTTVTVSATDSWVQFFKNIPMALIAFTLLESNIFTREYQTGTLVPMLTKGLKRYKIVIAKTAVTGVLWTLGYWICVGITYGYNEYFWDNSTAQNLVLSIVCPWLFGFFVLSLMILFSAIFSSNTGVLVGTGGVVLASYAIGLIPKVQKYLPTLLLDGNPLLYGTAESKSYVMSIIICVGASIACFALSIPLFNKKQL